MTTKYLRPDRGWPALFENWEIGDSMPVVGDMLYVKRTMQDYFAQKPKLLEKFTLASISPTLTRVTRIS